MYVYIFKFCSYECKLSSKPMQRLLHIDFKLYEDSFPDHQKAEDMTFRDYTAMTFSNNPKNNRSFLLQFPLFHFIVISTRSSFNVAL